MSQMANVQAMEIARRVALNQAIARRSDTYSERVRGQAETLARVFRQDKTQVRGLETLAYTTDKRSDVFDWLKVRIGRDDGREKKKWGKERIGHQVLEALESLRADAQRVTTEVNQMYPEQEENSDLEREVHLRLIREYLKHLVAHFEYKLVERQR